MSENYIKREDDGSVTSFVGTKATDIYSIVVLRQCIKFWLTTEALINRQITPTKMARGAEHYTGKRYPVSKNGLGTAYVDLQVKLEQLKQEVDVVDKDGKVMAPARNK